MNILTRDFFPDYSAVAKKMTGLAEDLTAAGIDVQVYTANPQYYCREKPEKRRNIRRVLCTSFDKDNLLLRAINEVSFGISIFAILLFSKKKMNIIPSLPFSLQLSALLLRKIRNQDYIIINYEIMPELMCSSGLMSYDGPFFRMLNKIAKKVLDNARCIITLTASMSKKLESKVRKKIVTIPNWTDTDVYYPIKRKENEFLRRNKLSDSFVVSYSGNFGRYMDFDTVLKAAELLPQIRFLFIGNGAQKGRITKADNIFYHDYLPNSRINESLNSGNIALVLTNQKDDDYVMPSKILDLMAAGRPIVAVSRNSEIKKIIARSRNGFVVNPGEPDSLKRAILALKNDKKLQKEMGKNSRDYAARHFSRKKITGQYVELLKKNL